MTRNDETQHLEDRSARRNGSAHRHASAYRHGSQGSATETARSAGGMRVPGSWLLLGLFLIGLATTGCEEDAGPLPGNAPPTTFLEIQGPELDTLSYRQILSWWGSDPDGEIVGYCVRWDGEWTPPEDAVRCDFDDSFWFTTATTDTFVVPTNGEFAERTFTVRAVDDDGVIDPEGKSQVFRLSNWRPDLSWSPNLTRPAASLPAVTFGWSPRDLDGYQSVTEFRVWLDGQDSLDALITTDTLFALAPEDFEDRFGERTLFVQAVDEARTSSNVIRHTWTVEPPPDADFLLIDNASSFTPGAFLDDLYFRAIMDSVAAGNYFVYDVQERGDFRSDREVAPLFSLFDGVVWYGGFPREANDVSNFHNLNNAEAGLRDYLQAGGQVALFNLIAVGDSAGLSPSFAEEVLGIEQFYRNAAGEHDLALDPSALVGTRYLAPGDSLENRTAQLTADFFRVAGDVEGTFAVAPGYFPEEIGVTPDQSDVPAFLGVRSERLGGAFEMVAFLPSRARGNANEHQAGANLLRDLFGR